MKSIHFVAFGAITALALMAQPAPPAAELKLDDVIKKSIEAQGGLEKIKAIHSMKLTGKMILGGGQMEAPVVSYMKRPHSNRMEITIQGQQIVDAYDGTTKWMINPMMGSKDPQKAPEDETKAAADDSDIVEGPLIDYKEKGSTVELLGKEYVEGSMAYKIKVTFKSGRTRMIFIDEKSFLTVKEIMKIKQMGQEFEAETMPGNYKKVEGVTIPFSSEMKVNQQVGMQLQFDKVEVNVPVDDAVFVFPEVKKADPPKAQ
jgi:outer membrane lipoprotein-sorting protein